MSATERTQAGRDDSGTDLAAAVEALSDRIEALQADVRRLGGPALPAVEPGWDEEAVAPPAASYAWVGALGAPASRRPGVPRLLLEVLFLAAVAVAAGLADLDAPVIAAVMVGAWALVALIEWTAARAERRRDELLFAPAPPPAAPVPVDPAWFAPPVEQTLLEMPADSVTAVAKLPPTPEAEATAERRPGS